MSAVDTQEDRRRSRTLMAVVGICALCGVSVPLWVAGIAEDSEAAFSDTEIFGTNTLGAATLDLEVGLERTSLGAQALTPGDVITGRVELVNAGTLPMLVSATASADGAVLSEWLGFEFWAGDATCEGGPTGSITRLSEDPTPVVGGDRGAATDAGAIAVPVDASRLVCVRASLPLAAPNEIQGQRLLLDLTFDAVHDLEQAE